MREGARDIHAHNANFDRHCDRRQETCAPSTLTNVKIARSARFF
jgi:hypothetical protein